MHVNVFKLMAFDMHPCRDFLFMDHFGFETVTPALHRRICTPGEGFALMAVAFLSGGLKKILPGLFQPAFPAARRVMGTSRILVGRKSGNAPR